MILFIALLGTMKNAILYNLYEFDRSFFIESFCVNKNRPELKCNGKCELAKMRKQEDERTANDLMKNLKSDVTFYFPAHQTILDNIRPASLEDHTDYPLFCNHMVSYLLISKSVKPPDLV